MEDSVEGGHFVEDAADVDAKKLRLRQEQGMTVLFSSVSRYRHLICCVSPVTLCCRVTSCYHGYLVLLV